MVAPSSLSHPKELLINIEAYHYKVWMTSRAAFNLTFPSPGWKDLKFRYQDLRDKKRILCRQFSLFSVELPLFIDLMWDCPVFDKSGDDDWDLELTVISNEGKGGTYIFKNPEEFRIDQGVTKLEDWHVFFFVHADHIGRSPNLPITIQLAPFKNVSYSVSLVKCVDDRCQQWTSITSIIVNESEISHASFEDNHLTVLLPAWNNPAVYAVTTQIVSPKCSRSNNNHSGCFISRSPLIEIKQSKLGIIICTAFGLALIFAFSFFITLHNRVKEKKKLLLALKEKPTTVLLIYLPENQHCLDLVKVFADFLKDACFVHPYVIDNDVRSQDPNYWTVEHMNKADRLLFLVPGNTSGESITPIRDHWVYALHYLSGHYFATHQVTNKVATILFPFSTDVPPQIANVQRFKLMQDMDLLVTWIHSGTWLDCKFVWGPLIRSRVQSVTTYTLLDIDEAVVKASRVTGDYNDMINGNSEKKNFVSDIMYMNKIQPLKENSDNKDSSLTSFTTDSKEDVFDPDIPNVKELLILGQETSYIADDS
ncbi:uncharacterized protein [Panulirus ornatus]